MARSSPVVVATVAAAFVASSCAAVIAAAPASADILHDWCAGLPAEDPCHVAWNVPADPAIPPYPPPKPAPYVNPWNFGNPSSMFIPPSPLWTPPPS